MINKIDLRKAISSIAISNAKRNTIYKAFSDLDSITKEEFDSVKSDISKVVESMLTKDTVGKANGVASLDSNGNVPIEQLGNIDTTLFLIVRLPTTDIQSNKIYLVPNQDGQGNNVYIEYLYVEGVWEKVGEFKPEVDLSHIEAKLNTKADKTDVNSRLDDLSNYCFKLGPDGRISTPFYDNIMNFNKKIQQLNNNEEYTYADISEDLDIDKQQFIYDKTLNKFIKIIEINEEIIDKNGDFFRTSEPLDLTHTFYLDNEKTGIVENLYELAIEESNVFVNLPYLETNNILDDDTAPQYIYDATDNKWIEVVETYYSSDYYVFNTEEPLDLTHELCYSISNVFVDWTVVGKYSVALGANSSANSTQSVAVGADSSANSTQSVAVGYKSLARNNAVALGCNANTSFANIALGYNANAGMGNNVTYDDCIAIGSNSKVTTTGGIVIGHNSSVNCKNTSFIIGSDSKTDFDENIIIGDGITSKAAHSIIIGKPRILSKTSCYSLNVDGGAIMEVDRENYGLYLKSFGGYDGTNLVINSGDTETINPNIKSVQQIINEKADASAIPTKVSQLTNDSNFVTPNDNAIFAGLTIHNNARIRYIQKYHHDDEYTYLIAETPADRVANKVFAADGSLFDVSKLVKTIDCKVSGDWNNIEFGYTNADNERSFILVPNVTKLAPGIMTAADKVKLDSLPSITSKLVNITTATTAEEVVTKFNALLADLKAKGYMEADTPQ